MRSGIQEERIPQILVRVTASVPNQAVVRRTTTKLRSHVSVHCVLAKAAAGYAGHIDLTQDESAGESQVDDSQMPASESGDSNFPPMEDMDNSQIQESQEAVYSPGIVVEYLDGDAAPADGCVGQSDMAA